MGIKVDYGGKKHTLEPKRMRYLSPTWLGHAKICIVRIHAVYRCTVVPIKNKRNWSRIQYGYLHISSYIQTNKDWYKNNTQLIHKHRKWPSPFLIANPPPKKQRRKKHINHINHHLHNCFKPRDIKCSWCFVWNSKWSIRRQIPEENSTKNWWKFAPSKLVEEQWSGFHAHMGTP